MGEVQQVRLPLGLELVPDPLELLYYHVHLLEVQLRQGVELLDVREDLDQLLEALDELVEFVEDLGL